jgi:hypothetical protein
VDVVDVVAHHHAHVFTAQTKSLRQSDFDTRTKISSAADAEHRFHSASRFVIILSAVVNEFRYRFESPSTLGSDYRVTLSA